MSKRKRAEDDIAGDVSTNAAATATTTKDFRRQRRIVAAFTQSAAELAKAFKTARGFERQKLGRRLKTATAEKQDDDIARINREIRALKALDLASCAQHHLSKCLLKIKAVATSPHLPKELGSPSPFSTDSAALNVHARLCDSNPVKHAFPTLFSTIKSEFGVVDEKKGKRLRAKDYEGLKEAETINAAPPDASDAALEHVRASAGNDSGDELEQYEHRLASSDSGQAEQDSSSSDIDDLERRLAEEGIPLNSTSSKSRAYNHASEVSTSEGTSDADSEDDRPRKVDVSRKSAFIPSLTMGGYISGSGSDLEDDIDVAPKKNRRGQRARQQIWEQKFGSRANHLKNQQGSRGDGWDMKRGAVGGLRGTKPGSAHVNRGTNANSMSLGRSSRIARPANARADPKRPSKDDTGPLHPSWEAAKRAKEKKSAPVAFQGKKISFD